MAINFKKQSISDNGFLNEVAKELGLQYEMEKAGRISCTVLQTLRNNLAVEKSAALAQLLPDNVKLLYVYNWRTRKRKKAVEFTDQLVDALIYEDKKKGNMDLANEVEALRAIITVFNVLRKHMPEKDFETMQQEILPSDLYRVDYERPLLA